MEPFVYGRMCKLCFGSQIIRLIVDNTLERPYVIFVIKEISMA
jgi:hypothetical protein